MNTKDRQRANAEAVADMARRILRGVPMNVIAKERGVTPVRISQLFYRHLKHKYPAVMADIKHFYGTSRLLHWCRECKAELGVEEGKQ